MDAANLTLEQAADVVIAEGFGWQACKEGTARAPAHCKNLAPLLTKHGGPVGSTIVLELLKAWNRGFHACRAELVGVGDAITHARPMAELTDDNTCPW